VTTWISEFARRGDYDEAIVLEQYLRHNFAHLMTPFEAMALNAFTTRDVQTLRTLGQAAGSHHRGEDPEVLKALAVGQEPFLKKVFQRVLRDHASSIVINRCPKCQRIVASPAARQCLWCGHHWHLE
jgi:hypothetical protein